MKPILPILLAALFLSACESKKDAAAAPSEADATLIQQDTPILPVNIGDAWIYQVHLEIPADVTSAGASAVDTKHQRTRTYLGKVSAAQGLPETDCFEIHVPGSAKEREFVDIQEDRILMHGSLILREDTTQPMWLATPIPFIIAGAKPGTSLPEFKTTDGSLNRKTEIIAREDITVPAGTFHCIRMLTTGGDGDIELRRTIWFAPGKGIIREEKTRYRHNQLIYRETHQLQELKKAP
jgi:hypothetical protein